jgi:hypothetical protein
MSLQHFWRSSSNANRHKQKGSIFRLFRKFNSRENRWVIRPSADGFRLAWFRLIFCYFCVDFNRATNLRLGK